MRSTVPPPASRAGSARSRFATSAAGRPSSLSVSPGRPAVAVTSVAVGSLRLASRYPTLARGSRSSLIAARADVAAAFADVDVRCRRALATGGAARAARKLVGETLGPDRLQEALQASVAEPFEKLARRYDLAPHRTRTLAAGIVILAEVQRRLGVPLEVSRSGLREGLALELLEDIAAA